MTREERENAIRCLKLWIEKEPYIQTYKTCLEALEQSMPTMVYPQVDGITPTVVAQADGEKTCGTCRNEDTYHCAECENKSDYEQSQADGEYKSNKELLCDSCYRKIAGCQAKFHNPHPVDHCIEYKPIETQADGEYISKENMGHWIWQTEDIYQCSECGEDIHVKEVMNEPQYAWCPICGCPMEIER